jgi:hypothetical protein
VDLLRNIMACVKFCKAAQKKLKFTCQFLASVCIGFLPTDDEFYDALGKKSLCELSAAT